MVLRLKKITRESFDTQIWDDSRLKKITRESFDTQIWDDSSIANAAWCMVISKTSICSWSFGNLDVLLSVSWDFGSMLIFVIDSIFCQIFLNLKQQSDLSGWASVSVIIGLDSSSNALVDHCKTISNAYMPSFLCSFFPPLVRIGEYTIVLMDPEGRKFGRGPRELGGSIDLLNYYKLERHHEFFCKRSLPSSISKTQYLQNVVGETEIRKGEGMELDQLFQNSTSAGCRHKPLHPFQLDVLMDAFQLREATSTDLPCTKKRASGGSKLKGEDREGRKHKKHKHENRESKKDKHKNIETKIGSNMQSHPRVDTSRDKDKEYKRTGDHSFGYDHFLKQERVSKISTFLPL